MKKVIALLMFLGLVLGGKVALDSVYSTMEIDYTEISEVIPVNVQS